MYIVIQQIHKKNHQTHGPLNIIKILQSSTFEILITFSLVYSTPFNRITSLNILLILFQIFTIPP